MAEKREKIWIKTGILVFAVINLLTVLPIVVVGWYDVPRADDFCFSQLTHRAWVDTRSLWNILKTAAAVTADYFNTWQGTYSSIFLMTLQPGLWTERAYCIVPLLFAGVLFFSVWYLADRMIVSCFKQDRKIGLLMALIMFPFMIQEVPGYVDTFFWYNSAVHYTLSTAVTFITVGLFADTLFSEKNRLKLFVFLPLCGAYLGGGNLVSLMESVLLACLSVFLLFLTRNQKKIPAYLPFYLVLAAGAAANLLCPGNAGRMSYGEVEGAGIVGTILHSFVRGMKFFVFYFSPINVCMLMILFPLLVYVMCRFAESSSFRFPCPILWWGGSYCLICAMYAPIEYTGLEPESQPRVLTPIYFSAVLLAVFCIMYSLGWIFTHKDAFQKIRQKVEQKDYRQKRRILLIYCAAVWFISGAYIVWHGVRRPVDFTSEAALVTLQNGDAKEYYTQCEAIFHELKTNPDRRVVIEPFTVMPVIFTNNQDIIWDNLYWKMGTRIYYDKDSVVFTFELKDK